MNNFHVILAATAAVFAAFGEITIRSDYPGGNVKVCGIDEANGVVRIAPDLRDTQGRWFHWDFTLRGAAGRKIRFMLPDDKWQYISSLGPAISKDGYSLCGGVYSFPAARELGRNMLKALVRTAQASEKPYVLIYGKSFATKLLPWTSRS